MGAALRETAYPWAVQHTSESAADRLRRRCIEANNTPGKLTGYDCPDCMNRGLFHDVVVKNEIPYEVVRRCRCMEIREIMRNIEVSGLSDLLESCTFDTFTADESWQADIKAAALRFLDDDTGRWFVLCGQVGAGKTHICTAMVGELLRRGIAARYMRWKDESTKLKALVTDEEYGQQIEIWKTASVLYIDDFFKVKSGKDRNGNDNHPTQGDANIAFEILNHRYISRTLVTIITSEHTVDKLMEFDEATGSRIYERSKGFCINLSPDRKKNRRLAGNRA